MVAIYGSSISYVFAARCTFSPDKTTAICAVNEGLPDQRTYVCVKTGDKWDCKFAEAPGNTPPSLDDAIAKADNVKPDLKGGNENGNNTKPPKDLGGFNINESGPGSNDDSELSEDFGGLEFRDNTTKPELQ
jgi:hypothetical protein